MARARRNDPLDNILNGDLYESGELPREMRGVPGRDIVYVTPEVAKELEKRGIVGFKRSHAAGGEAIPVYKGDPPQPVIEHEVFSVAHAAEMLGVSSGATLVRWLNTHKDRFTPHYSPHRGHDGRPKRVLTMNEIRAIGSILSRTGKFRNKSWMKRKVNNPMWRAE